jgi:hypothetical protein
LTPEKVREEATARFGRFRYLPPIVLAVWFVLRLISFKIDIKVALP